MKVELMSLEAAKNAVVKASAVCRAVQARLDEVRQITKDDRSPVTVADFAAQAVVCHELSNSIGSFLMVGEEDAAALRSPDQAAVLGAVVDAVQCVWAGATAEDVLEAIDMGGHDASGDDYWTLDPIDGTKGFLRGQQYCVSLGFIQKTKVTLGVLGCPNLAVDESSIEANGYSVPDGVGTLAWATVDGGAFAAPLDDVTNVSPLHAPTAPRAGGVRACGSVEKAHSNISGTDQALASLPESFGGVNEPARLDSQCKYAVVARGWADAYLRLPTKAGYIERIWDHAAGSLVAQEAGCIVSDASGKPLDFGRGLGLEDNAGVVVAPAYLHGALIDAIVALELYIPPAPQTAR